MNFFNIACITDDNYAQHAGVMLYSLLSHSSCPCRIFLLTNSLNNENTNKLKETVKNFSNCSIQFITMTNEDLNFSEYSIGNQSRQWASIMYMKLFIHNLLPQEIKKILFLDVDIIVNDDIKELYATNIDKCVIAAAEDWKYNYFAKERIGLAHDDVYINSGVMLINLSRWREKEAHNPIQQFMINNKKLFLNDQDVIALYFKDEIQYIPQEWNVTTFYFERVPRIPDKYIPLRQEICTNPRIIHFCAPIKPWFKECRHPYRKLYKNILEKTPWHNYQYPSCKTYLGIPAWQYMIKYWLNKLHIRNDDWYLLPIKNNLLS